MEAALKRSVGQPAHLAASPDTNFSGDSNRQPNSSEMRRKTINDKRLVWISELVLDRHLYRTCHIEMLRHLAKRGFTVELVATRSKERYSTDDLKVCCIPLRFAPPFHIIFFSVIMFLFLPIYVLVKKPRFIVTDPGPWILAFFLWKPVLSRCMNVKVILDFRSITVEVLGWQMAVKDLFFRISVLIAKRMFDGITTVTSLMRDDIAKSFQMGPNEIGFWVNGVSTQFDPAKYAAEGALLRHKYGLTDTFVVLYHGIVSQNRALIEAARSLEMLDRDKYNDVVLFILGSGPALSTIRRLVDERGLQGRVILHDPVHYNEVPKYIAMADVGLVPLPNHPDWAHQCPLNLLEYLAMEKPVIITDIPCNRWIVDENKCGTYAKDADPKEFAKAISYLHDNRKMLKQWGAQGRRIVEERFDWNIIAEGFENYLVNL